MSNKTELNQYAHSKRIPTPVYASVTEGCGFSSTVTVGGKEYRSTQVRSTKKAAENDAAGVALGELTCVVERSIDSETVKLERMCLAQVPFGTGAVPFGERPEVSAVGGERPEPQGTAQVPLGAVRTTTQIMPPAPDGVKALPTSYTLRATHLADTDLSKKLEQLNDRCKAMGLTEPTFTISEHSSKFTASITIGNHKDIIRTQDSYTSFQDAKLAVTELAIDYLTTRRGATTRLSLQAPPTTPSHSSTLPPLIPPAFFTGTPPPSSLTLVTPRTTHSPHLLARSPSLSLGHSPPPSLGSPEPTTDPAGPPRPRDSGANPKGQLDHYCQKNRIPLPQYTTEFAQDEVGYLVSVSIGDKVYRSSVPQLKKKMAESEAAAQALLELEGRGGGDGREERPQGVDGTSSASQGRAVPVTPAPPSYKNILQEYAQRGKLATPHYETMLSDEGFRSTVSLTDRSGKPWTFSSDGQQAKKTAEQQAAQRACSELKLV